MRRGAKRKPTKLRVIEGNRGHRPIPQGEPEPPAPIEVPSPPVFLHRYAKRHWAELAPILFDMGLLTVVDSSVLAAYCQAYARWRVAEEALAREARADEATSGIVTTTTSGNKIQNPLISTANGAMRDMVRIASEFGLSPAARAVIENKRKNEDPVDAKYFS